MRFDTVSATEVFRVPYYIRISKGEATSLSYPIHSVCVWTNSGGLFVWYVIQINRFADWLAENLNLLCIWITACQPTWTIQADTNVNFGQRNSASTVQDCQAACVRNIDCTGFDYVSSALQGERCWLSGWWSGRRNNGNTPGITHYDINRSCSGIFY